MSYTPTTWVTDDVISAEKLNNIEQGVVNAGNAVVFEFIATWDITSHNYIIATDVTFEQVKTAFLGGKLCIAHIIAGEDETYDIVLDFKGFYNVEGVTTRMGLGSGSNYLNIENYVFSGDGSSGWRFSVDEFKVALFNG